MMDHAPLLHAATRDAGRDHRGAEPEPGEGLVHRSALAAALATALLTEAALLLHLADAGVAAVPMLALAALAAWALTTPRIGLAIAMVLTVCGALVVRPAPTIAADLQIGGVGALAIALMAIVATVLALGARNKMLSLTAAYNAALRLRRRADARSREARSRLHDFVVSVDDVYWETDSQMRLRFVSKELRRQVGKAGRPLLGSDPLEVAERVAGRYGRMPALLARLRRQQPVWGMRLAWRDRSHRRRTWIVYAQPKYDLDGHLVGYRGVLVDGARRGVPSQIVPQGALPRGR